MQRNNNPETLLVGIGGRARTGKDTMAQFLHSFLPFDSRLYSFANALKCYCRLWHGMKEKDPGLLQETGLQYRKMDPNVWIRMLDYQIWEERPRIAIISDMRFMNEKQWIERDGISIRMEKLDEGGWPMISADRDPLHPSEAELEGVEFDHMISAKEGDIGAIHTAAFRIVNEIIRHWSKQSVSDVCFKLEAGGEWNLEGGGK